MLGNIENILLNGTQLILNQVFKLTGFDSIEDGILKHLVIARLCQPSSKAGTVDYLKSYFDEDVELPIVEDFVQRFNLDDFVVVADSGLMNKTILLPNALKRMFAFVL